MRYSLLLSVPQPRVTTEAAPRRRALWLWAMLLAVLADCGGPQAPSPEDVRRALQVYFDAHPVCLPVAFKFPADARAGDASVRAPLDALAAAGLARVQKAQRQEIGAFSGSARSLDMLHYELTDGGRAVVRPGRDRFLGGSDLCFAKREVIAVEAIAPPPDLALSTRQARVTYRYRLAGVAPWTEKADVRAAIPGIARMLVSSSGTAADTLALGDHGWARVETQPAP